MRTTEGKARRWAQALEALLLACALAACGPGTGGTGTGPGQGQGSLTPGAEPPSDQVEWFLGHWEGTGVQAQWEAERIRIRQGCTAVQYLGAWKPSAAGEVQLTVQFTQAPGALATGQGSLVATAHAGRILHLSVRDAQGNAVVAPVDLRLQPGAAALPPDC